MQRDLYIQESSEIGDLGLEPRVYLRCKLVKWLHYHIQMVLLSLALPDSYRTTIYQQSRV